MLIHKKHIQLLLVVINRIRLPKLEEKTINIKKFKSALLKLENSNGPSEHMYGESALTANVVNLFEKNKKESVEGFFDTETLKFINLRIYKIYNYVKLMNRYFNDLAQVVLHDLDDIPIKTKQLKDNAAMSGGIIKSDIKNYYTPKIQDIKIKVQKLIDKVNAYNKKFSFAIIDELEKIATMSSDEVNVYNGEISNSCIDLKEIFLKYDSYVLDLLNTYEIKNFIVFKKFDDYARYKFIKKIFNINNHRIQIRDINFEVNINFIKCLSRLLSNIYDEQKYELNHKNLFIHPPSLDIFHDLYKHLNSECGNISMSNEAFISKTKFMYLR